MISSQFLIDVTLRRETIPDAGAYPFSLPALRGLGTLPLDPAVTFLVGENGTGKSTLIEAIAVACGFNAEGGSRNFRFGTRESHSVLHQHLRVARGVRRPKGGFFLRAESFYNVATEIERLEVADAYGGVSLHERSHGEAFMDLLLHRFRGDGLYFLDEPEAALSPQRQLAALVRLHDLVRARAQFVIATHSPILMAYPGALIYQCSAGGIAPVRYEDTEHYRITRDFLAHPGRMLAKLLSTDDPG